MSDDKAEALRERCIMVNTLLDAVAHEKGMREREIIDRYFADRAKQVLSALLHDTGSLPEDIVVYCQNLLAPKTKTPS